MLTDDRQLLRRVIDIIIKGIVILSSATREDSGFDADSNNIVISAPNIKLRVKELLMNLESISFLCIIAEPIPVSEKLANTVVMAVIAA